MTKIVAGIQTRHPFFAWMNRVAQSLRSRLRWLVPRRIAERTVRVRREFVRRDRTRIKIRIVGSLMRRINRNGGAALRIGQHLRGHVGNPVAMSVLRIHLNRGTRH